jgi:hypothetical protein
MWHIAAPDVGDGTSAVGESRHSKAHPLVQPTEPCCRIAQLDQRTALPDQCLHSAEADVRPPRSKAANRIGIAPRQKSKGLRDISNPSKRRSTDHEIVAPSFWE